MFCYFFYFDCRPEVPLADQLARLAAGKLYAVPAPRWIFCRMQFSRCSARKRKKADLRAVGEMGIVHPFQNVHKSTCQSNSILFATEISLLCVWHYRRWSRICQASISTFLGKSRHSAKRLPCLTDKGAFYWYARQDSNLRPSESESDTLSS